METRSDGTIEDARTRCSLAPGEVMGELEPPRGVEPLAIDAPDTAALPHGRRVLLGLDWEQPAYFLVTLLGSLGLLWIGGQVLAPLSHTIVLFILAAVLAFTLSSPVGALAARTGRLPAVVAIYLIAGAVIVGGVLFLAQPVARQASALLASLPSYTRELSGHAGELEGWLRQFGVAASIDDINTRVASGIRESATLVASYLIGSAANVGGALGDATLILVISFFLLLDGQRLLSSVLAVIPGPYHDTARFVGENVVRVLGGYLRGQLITAASTGLVAWIGCALLGLPYALVLGVLAGLFALVPMFGPYLSGAPAILVALFQPFPTVIWVLLFFIVLQQVEGNIVGPRITGDAVGLHPLAALFALLAGFQLWGMLGGLLAVPVAGIIWALVTAAYRRRGRAGPGHSEPACSSA